jgi:hypothetical protein
MNVSMWNPTLIPFIVVIVCGTIAAIIAHYELEIRESIRQIKIVIRECLMEILNSKAKNILNIAEGITEFWFDLLKILIVIGAITIVAEHANDSALNIVKTISYICLWVFIFTKLSKAMLFVASKMPETIKRRLGKNKENKIIKQTKIGLLKVIYIYIKSMLLLSLIEAFIMTLTTFGVIYVENAWTKVIDIAIKLSSLK